MSKPITQRISLGILQNVLSMLVVISNKFILFAVFSEQLGLDTYGDWLFIFSISTSFLALNFGWNKSIINTQILNFKSYSASAPYFLSNLLFILFCMLIIFIGASIYTYSVDSVYKEALLLLICYTLLRIPSRVIISQYTVYNKFYRSRMILNIEEVAQIVLLLVALHVANDFVILAFCYIAPTLIIACFVLYQLIYKIRSEIDFKEISLKHIKSNLKVSFRFFLLNMTETAVAQGPVILIGKSLSKGLLPFFVAHRTISNSAKTVFYTINSVMIPEFSHAYRDYRNDDKLKNLFYLFFSVVILGGLSVIIFINFLGDQIFTLWLKDSITYNKDLMQLLLVVLFLNFLRSAPGTLLNSLNLNKGYSFLDAATLICIALFVLISGFEINIENVVYLLISYESVLLLVALGSIYQNRIKMGLSFNSRFNICIISTFILVSGSFSFFNETVASVLSLLFIGISLIIINSRYLQKVKGLMRFSKKEG